jgi:3-oxoacyl-[acyl-carrier protein] reductase
MSAQTTQSDPAGPVCLITGGSSGIGLATAQRFARGGFRIGIGARDTVRLESARREIQTASKATDVWAETLNLASPAEAAPFVDRAHTHFGRIDVLVLSAAVAPLSSLDEFTSSQFESAINVNVRSTFYLVQAAWNFMARQPTGGSIVNISSQAAIDPYPGFSVYGACKAWGELFIQALANEGKPHRIRVHSVRPGAVETPMLRGLFPDYPSAEALDPAAVAELIWSVCSAPFQYSSGYAISIRR